MFNTKKVNFIPSLRQKPITVKIFKKKSVLTTLKNNLNPT